MAASKNLHGRHLLLIMVVAVGVAAMLGCVAAQDGARTAPTIDAAASADRSIVIEPHYETEEERAARVCYSDDFVPEPPRPILEGLRFGVQTADGRVERFSFNGFPTDWSAPPTHNRIISAVGAYLRPQNLTTDERKARAREIQDCINRAIDGKDLLRRLEQLSDPEDDTIG